MIDPDKLNLISTISKARQMYLNGVSRDKIGKKLGIEPSKITPWVADINPDWEAALDQLLAKGYIKSEIITLLCEKVNCSKSTARSWLSKDYKPTIPAQLALVALNDHLDAKPYLGWDGDWRAAVDSMLEKGYKKTELVRKLRDRTSYGQRAAMQWFSKKNVPPIPAQIEMVNLDQELPPLPDLPDWKTLVDELLGLGYNISELARMLQEHIDCNIGTAKFWFYKKNTPPPAAQIAIANLHSRLSALPDWKSSVNSLLAKGYSKNELGRMLSDRIDCKPRTAVSWLAKKSRPPALAKIAIIKLDEELPSLIIEENWEDAVDRMLDKGYSRIQLARILCRHIGCNPLSAQRWFAKKFSPSLYVRAAIIEMEKKLADKKSQKRTLRRRNPDIDPEMLNELSQRAKARELYLKGVGRTEISRRLGLYRAKIRSYIIDLIPDEDPRITQARELYQNCTHVNFFGKPDLKKIGEKVGKSVGTIHRWKKEGLLGPEKKCLSPRQQKVKDAYQGCQFYKYNRHNIKGLGRLVNASPQTIERWLKRGILGDPPSCKEHPTLSPLGRTERRGAERYDIAKQLYQDCVYVNRRNKPNLTEIGKHVGVGMQTVKRWLQNGFLGEEITCGLTETQRRAKELYQGCKYINHMGDPSIRAIANELGISITPINGWIKKGLLGDKPVCMPNRYGDVAALHEQGHSIREISNILKRPLETVRFQLRKFKETAKHNKSRGIRRRTKPSRIKKLRIQKGLLQKDLARLADVTISAVRRAEQGLSKDESLKQLLLDILTYDV